jgi:hypothetical protein
MWFPKYVLEDLSVGSGSIIGKSNIDEFFNHISMHKDVEEKSLAELAPSYEVASAYLVHMLKARFASPKRKLLSWKLCVENLEMLPLKLGKFLCVLISLARM